MTNSYSQAGSLLAIDVGAVTTRVLLFDVVDGRYRFLASGSASTTAGMPFFDIGEGLRVALEQLQNITGRQLIGSDEGLILPEQPDGSGIDTCVATASVGAPLKVVAVGLLDDVSVESILHLASTTYAEVVDKLSLNDRRKTATRLDAILKIRPDLIMIAGGTEGGASQSVMGQLEAVGLACYLIPENQKPAVLYAGNQSLQAEVDRVMGAHAHLSIAPNVRPVLEIEQLSPAQNQLANIYRLVRSKTLHGFPELDLWTGGKLIPTATAFGRMIRILSKVHASSKGVLGVDVGSTATVLAAAFSDDLQLGVYPEFGLGEHVPAILESGRLEEIAQWLPLDVPTSVLKDYIYNKSFFPSVLPATQEALAIESALARQAIRLALKRFSPRFPSGLQRTSPRLLPWFEPVIAAGGVLTGAPSHGHALLTLLDSLQPTGVTTLVLDQNNLTAALGAAVTASPILPVQVMETSSYLNLGSVISPVGSARYGTTILKVRVAIDGREETNIDVKYGGLEIIPISAGQSAQLHLQPLNRFDVGMGGPGRGGSVRVVGGVKGIVIDARGRPLRLPEDAGRRRELHKKWLSVLGS